MRKPYSPLTGSKTWQIVQVLEAHRGQWVSTSEISKQSGIWFNDIIACVKAPVRNGYLETRLGRHPKVPGWQMREYRRPLEIPLLEEPHEDLEPPLSKPVKGVPKGVPNSVFDVDKLVPFLAEHASPRPRLTD